MPLSAPKKDYSGRGGGGGGYSGLGIISAVREEQADLGRFFANIFRRRAQQSYIISESPVPLGEADFPFLDQGVDVPTLDAGLIVDEAVSVPPEIDRRDEPYFEAAMEVVDNWFDFNTFKERGVRVLHSPSGTLWNPSTGLAEQAPAQPIGPVVPIIQAGIVESEEETMGVLGDIYDVVDTTLGGVLPGGVPLQIPSGWGGPLPQVSAAAPPVVINQPIPGVPAVASTSCDNDPMKGMVYKKICGQYRWVKQKRRRRKALATQSDLKGLAALKGVLGTGKAFEVWIATHS